MKRFCTLFISLALLLGICACEPKQEEPTWQEQYDLGVRYLSEGNYEEAIIAFTAAIEIDPKQPDAYAELSNVYLAMGDPERAKQILADGIAATGDEELQEILDEMSQTEQALKPDPNHDNLGEEYDGTSLEKGITDNMLHFDEIQFLGHPIEGLTIEQMKNIMLENELEISELDQPDHLWISGSKNGVYSTDVTAMQYKDESYVTLWGYKSYLHAQNEEELSIGIREIKTRDTVEKVLTEFGFSNGAEITAYLEEISTKEFSSTEEMDAELENVLSCSKSFGIYSASGRGPYTDNNMLILTGFTIMFRPIDLPRDNLTYSFYMTFECNYPNSGPFQLTDYHVYVYE